MNTIIASSISIDMAPMEASAAPPRDTPVAGDDGDLLHAVMAFLEENDAVEVPSEEANSNSDSYASSQSDAESRKGNRSSSIASSASSPPLPHSPSPPAPPLHTGVLPRLQPRRPKVNRSRQRMREEIVALREQVLELQETLETAKGGVTARVGIFPQPKGNSSGASSSKNDAETRKLRALAWQALAQYESGKASAAEHEREKLRALLKEQKLAFRRLRRYLGKYSADSQWAAIQSELIVAGEKDDDQRDNEAINHKQPVVPPKDEFEDISRAIPAMYLQTSAMFHDARLEALTSSVRDLTIQNELTPSMSIEALDSRVVPFNVKQTADAVWQYHLTKVRMLSTAQGKTLEESSDSVRRVFESAIEHTDFTGTSRVRMETRRYPEAERVVIVQSALFDGMKVNGTLVPNFALRQYQWTVIGPPRNFILRHSGKEMAQVEVFEVTLPVLDHVTGMDKQYLLETVMNLCQSTAMVHLEMERESVESILMDSMLKNSTLDSSMIQSPGLVR